MVVRTDADGRPELTFDNAFPGTYASVVKTERRRIFKRVSIVLAVVIAWVSLALLISFGLGPSGSKPPSPLLVPAPAFAPTTNQVLKLGQLPTDSVQCRLPNARQHHDARRDPPRESLF